MAYLAPIHRPSSVRHAIKLSFLAPDLDDLIVAKANRIEIYTPNPQQPYQLTLQHSKTLYGKVTLLQKLRPAKSATDHLFVGTDRYHYFTLSWDAEKKELVTWKKYHDIAEKAVRDSQTGDRVHIDPTSRFLTLECFEGVINVLPIAHAGKGKRKAADNEIGELGDPIPVRIPELFVKSSCFVHKRQPGAKQVKPELALLWEDTNQSKMRLGVRELEYTPSLRPQEELGSAEFENPREAQGTIELGASHLIPLPPPMYGMLVIGETSISYVDEWDYKVIDRQPLQEATVWVAWCAVDEQRYVLADDYGKMYLVFVQQNSSGEYEGHCIDVLGITSRASVLVYLDGGRIFVGSHQGDSQVVQISEGSLEVIQTLPNVAPVLDFTVMDMGNRSSNAPVNEFSSGQARIVTGSGAFKDGSLRSVRSGVGLEDLGSIGQMGAPINNLFGLRSSATSEADDTLVVSFVSHTRIFGFSADAEVEEVEEFRGFNLGESTLHASSLPDGRAVQVTSSAIYLSDAQGTATMQSWHSPKASPITAVTVDKHIILISLSGAELVVLDASGPNIRVQTQRKFDGTEEVSCIALSDSTPGTCVAGFWKESKVSFLDLENLQTISTERVAEDDNLAVPRSLIIARILEEAPATLFVGLADGTVVTYSVDPVARAFRGQKSIVLGTQQANFALLPRGDGLQNVFATCEHPSLIYGADGRMVYSAVTAENATCICSFDSAAYPSAIAIATDDELKLAIVDEERTTHVQTLPVHETVRRIAYSSDLKAFGLGTIKRTLSAGEEQVESHFKLVDEVAFQELHTYMLNDDELIECCIRCKLDDGSGELAERFVIGTAYLDDVDQKTEKGRMIILEVTESRQLKLVTEISLKGACRCLGMVEGNIVAALIKTVVVYSFEYQTPSKPFLDKKAAYRTATAPIDICVTDNVIAVTDLMKSVSLVEYKRGRSGMPDTLLEVARHYETLWGTAVANVAENTYLASDAEGNLVVLQHDINGFSDEDKRRLRVTSEMLLGEMVNRIRRIDVTPTPGAIVVPRAFLATVEGSIYLFALIAPHKQNLLIQMQTKMAELVISPGGVPFGRFRGFRTGVRDMSEEGPQRFVDGELIGRFLDLSNELQLEVVKALPGLGENDVEIIRGMVEGLRRMH